jgi:tRNA (mo5U34)-methyltransferase
MLNFTQLKQQLSNTSLSDLGESLEEVVKTKLAQYTHGELSQWEELIKQLPKVTPSEYDLKNNVSIGNQQDLSKTLSTEQIECFINQLKTIHPWRKGPFSLFGIDINTEWRSDWKWERLLPHIAPLKNRVILDVGCGNGYHMWRMLGEQAKLVIGIDPSQKFLTQFSIIKNYLPDSAAHLLPLGIENMPSLQEKIGFDTIFSMGVLYHRNPLLIIFSS